jgi:hypothetical protein
MKLISTALICGLVLSHVAALPHPQEDPEDEVEEEMESEGGDYNDEDQIRKYSTGTVYCTYITTDHFFRQTWL